MLPFSNHPNAHSGLGVSDFFSLIRSVTSADRSHGTNCDVWIIWTNAKSLQSSQRDQRRESEVFALPQGLVASVLHVCSNNTHVSPINCACIRVNIWLWSAKALIGVPFCKEIDAPIFQKNVSYLTGNPLNDLWNDSVRISVFLFVNL